MIVVGDAERTKPAAAAAHARVAAPQNGNRQPSKDLLLSLGETHSARALLGMLGLPVSLPRRLQRTSAPSQGNLLGGASVVVGGGSSGSALALGVSQIVLAAGGAPYLVSAKPRLEPVEVSTERRL